MSDLDVLGVYFAYFLTRNPTTWSILRLKAPNKRGFAVWTRQGINSQSCTCDNSKKSELWASSCMSGPARHHTSIFQLYFFAVCTPFHSFVHFFQKWLDFLQKNPGKKGKNSFFSSKIVKKCFCRCIDFMNWLGNS